MSLTHKFLELERMDEHSSKIILERNTETIPETVPQPSRHRASVMLNNSSSYNLKVTEYRGVNNMII